MNHYGFDYGRGKTNINHETKIRFGVISMHKVDFWYEVSEPEYPTLASEEDQEFLEAYCFSYKQNGYKCFQDSDSSDIFVEESPYFTYACFCSPCAPGAVHLESPIEPEQSYPGGAHDKHGVSLENYKGYCFGHDFFESGKAPYPVFSVETGKQINP